MREDKQHIEGLNLHLKTSLIKSNVYFLSYLEVGHVRIKSSSHKIFSRNDKKHIIGEKINGILNLFSCISFFESSGGAHSQKMWFLIATIFIFAYIWIKKYFLYFEGTGFPYLPG